MTDHPENGSFPKKRKHPRTVAIFKVSYRDAERLADYTDNLSESGLFIATDQLLAKGESIEFEISFPGLVKPIRLKGEVAWRRTRGSLGDDMPAGVGVQIHFNNDLERHWLKELLAKFSTQDPQVGPSPAKPFVILLAEDNPAIREMFSKALTEGLADDHKVHLLQAEGPQEAQDLLLEKHVDLLLIEYRMCRSEGVDIFESLADEKKCPSVVVVGANDTEKEQALEGGADVFLKRPFPAKGLLATIRSLTS